MSRPSTADSIITIDTRTGLPIPPRLLRKRSDELGYVPTEFRKKVYKLSDPSIDPRLTGPISRLEQADLKTLRQLIRESEPDVRYIDRITTDGKFVRNLDGSIQQVPIGTASKRALLQFLGSVRNREREEIERGIMSDEGERSRLAEAYLREQEAKQLADELRQLKLSTEAASIPLPTSPVTEDPSKIISRDPPQYLEMKEREQMMSEDLPMRFRLGDITARESEKSQDDVLRYGKREVYERALKEAREAGDLIYIDVHRPPTNSELREFITKELGIPFVAYANGLLTPQQLDRVMHFKENFTVKKVAEDESGTPLRNLRYPTLEDQKAFAQKKVQEFENRVLGIEDITAPKNPFAKGLNPFGAVKLKKGGPALPPRDEPPKPKSFVELLQEKQQEILAKKELTAPSTDELPEYAEPKEPTGGVEEKKGTGITYYKKGRRFKCNCR